MHPPPHAAAAAAAHPCTRLPARQVIATSRSPYHEVAAQLGVGYFTDADDFCEEHPEVVILATSILSLELVGGA